MTYATLLDVQSYTQFTVSSSTEPSQQEVTNWLTQAEGEVEENRLSEHLAEDIYLDVPIIETGRGVYDAEWDAEAEHFYTQVGKRGLVVPLTNIIQPLIKITTLEKNDEDYTGTPDWDTLTEGPADGASFIVLESGNKQHGYALMFFDNYPMTGYKRLRMSYLYGYKVKTDIICEWVARTVAGKVLEALMGTNSPTGLRMLDMGGDVPFVYNMNYKDRIAKNDARLAEIESKYFPSTPSEASYVVF